MRILVVTQYYYPEPFRINEICEELVNRQNYVDVLTSIPNYPAGEIYKDYKNQNIIEAINGVRVFRCKIHPRHKGNINLFLNYVSFAKNSSYYFKELLNNDYDCIYVYQLSPVFSAIPAIKLGAKKRIPIVLYCLDIWPESICGKIKPNTFIFNRIKKKSIDIYNSVNQIIVTSPSFINYFKELGVLTQTQFLPQHSRDIFELSSYEQKTNETKITNFVFLGNIGISQNLSMVIKSFSNVKKRDFLFHIVGSGSELESVKKTISELGMTDYCILYGRQPKENMASFYRIADVCVLSLKEEGIVSNTIPGKLQEYMSAGKFVLASIGEDASEIIRKANCGLVSKCGDVDTLTKNIEKVINKEVDIAGGGKKAREYYERNFTLKEHVNSLEKVLLKNCR